MKRIFIAALLMATVLLCATAAAQTIAVNSETTAWTDGNTYTVSGEVTIPSRVKVTGNAALQLNAGAVLNCEKGITVAEGDALTIGGSGTLNADASGFPNGAGIGGEQNVYGIVCGTIIINGGTITATGGSYGAGIGGGRYSLSGDITINGGHVTATGGTCGAGIGGGGNDNWGGNYGSVTTITINGGTVTATGDSTAADIGGGGGTTYESTIKGGSAGTIRINGGQVTANVNGIGPGLYSDSGSITLGWTNGSDFIQAAVYRCPVSFAEGKQFRTENGTEPVGTDGIGGQRIVPYIAPVLYDVTVSEGIEHGTVTAEPVRTEAGKTITLTIVPAADYELDNLTVTGPDGAITVTNGQFTMPAGNVTVSASFRRCSHTVTIAATEHGTVTAEPASARAGDTVTLTVTPDTDYELDSLTVTGPDGGITATNGQFTMPAGDVSVTAAFRRCSHTVTVSEDIEHGTVTADPASAMAGDTVTLTVTPDTDYEPDSLTVTGPDGGITVTNGQFTMPAGDVTVSASFRRCSHTVTVREDTEHGTVSADPASARAGDTVTLTVTPDTGYTLDSLTVTGPDGGITVTNGQFTMPGGDVIITAVFRGPDLTVTTEGEGAGYTFEDGVLTLGGTGIYHISMREGVEQTTDRIVITGAPEVHLNNVSIDVSGTTLPAVTRQTAQGNVILYVSGTNVLRTGTGKCGLDMSGFCLRSDDDGALYAYGGDGADGIPGNMTIESGALYAYGGEGADGTGTYVSVNGGKLVAYGANGVGENLTVCNDGQVEAHGAANGCGIGAHATITGGTVTAEGRDGIGANCTISGGTVTATGSSYGIGPNCTITRTCKVRAYGENGGDAFGDGLTVDAYSGSDLMGMGRYGVAGSMDLINGSIQLLGDIQALQSGTLVVNGGYRGTGVYSGSNASSTVLNHYEAGSTAELTDRYLWIYSFLEQSRIDFSDEAKDHILTVEYDRHDGDGWSRYYKPGPDGYGSLNNFMTIFTGNSFRMNFDIPVVVTTTVDPAPEFVSSSREEGKFTEIWTLGYGVRLIVDVDHEHCATVTYQDDDGSVMKTVNYYKGDTANLWTPEPEEDRTFTGWTLNGEAVTAGTMAVTEDITLTAAWTYRAYYAITAENCVVRDEDGNVLTSAYEGKQLYVNADDITVPEDKYCTGYTINGTFCSFGSAQSMPAGDITVAPVFKSYYAITAENCVVRDKDGNALTSAYEGQRLYVSENDVTVPQGKFCTGYTINGSLYRFGNSQYMPAEDITVVPVIEDGVTVTIDLSNGKRLVLTDEEANGDEYAYLWWYLFYYFMGDEYLEEENIEVMSFDINGDDAADVLVEIDSDYSCTFYAGEGAIMIDHDIELSEPDSMYTYIIKLSGTVNSFDFILPEDTQRIDAYAFQGIAAMSVYVPDGCTAIGEYAFGDCIRLQRIRLPKNCTIDQTAFNGCKRRVMIIAPAGGTTEAWAAENSFIFVRME